MTPTKCAIASPTKYETISKFDRPVAVRGLISLFYVDNAFLENNENPRYPTAWYVEGRIGGQEDDIPETDWFPITQFSHRPYEGGTSKPMGFCRNYENMPVVKEFRVFVDGDKIECFHPYWPKDALERGQIEWLPENSFYPEGSLVYLDISNRCRIDYLAEQAGGILGGRWSVDILDVGGSYICDEYRWYITDLAEADKSWHWPDCRKNQERK